jgi:hypothetical protein
MKAEEMSAKREQTNSFHDALNSLWMWWFQKLIMFRGWVQRPSSQTVQKLTGECPRVPYQFDPYKPPKNEGTMTPISAVAALDSPPFYVAILCDTLGFCQPLNWEILSKNQPVYRWTVFLGV